MVAEPRNATTAGSMERVRALSVHVDGFLPRRPSLLEAGERAHLLLAAIRVDPHQNVISRRLR